MSEYVPPTPTRASLDAITSRSGTGPIERSNTFSSASHTLRGSRTLDRKDEWRDSVLGEKAQRAASPENADPAAEDVTSPKSKQESVISISNDADGQLVIDWDGPDDPQNPKNWGFGRKWAATAIVSAFTFISPVSSSMVAPASEQVAQQFGITSSTITAMVISVFVLGYAFGPLFLGPLSEIYGRSRVLQWSNMFYLAWNIGCGFAQNTKQLVAFRFLAGLGGSAPLAIGGGVIGDTWKTEERGKAIALYSLAPLLGPVIGPVAGAWIAERSTWRWVFWSTSIVDVAIQVLGFFFLQETFAPVLLQRKALRIRKTMDPEKASAMNMRTIYDSSERHWTKVFEKALTRPFLMWFKEPIIQLLGVYMAFVYGLMYLFLTTMPAIFRDVYRETTGISGLHYIGLGLGLSGASQINARLLDRIYVYCKKRFGEPGRPEYRLPSIVPGTILTPVGLLIAGWCTEAKVHWIGTDIGIALVGAGTILNFQGIQSYIIDAFTLHAASGIAAVSFLRALAGFGFPLFAPAMYSALGYGKGDTILAAVAIVVGCPAPWLFWKYGERIRKSSKYASR